MTDVDTLFPQSETPGASCWQFGQWNFEAASLGVMGRLQDVQTGSAIDFCDKA